MLDDVSILLDGVCKELYPYIGTPDSMRNELTLNFPDVLAFTHEHEDHYDESYAKIYKKDTLRSVFGPELSCFIELGNVSIQGIPTRHIGKSDISHVSFIINGSKCVWFMGDASPLDIKKFNNFSSPDVIIVPYAYANTSTAWQITKSIGAKHIIILHLPERENDIYNLWETVESIVQDFDDVHILGMGDSIKIL